MPDIAALAVKIDSKDVKRGKLELVDFTKQAEKTEKTVKKTEKANVKVAKSFDMMSLAVKAAGAVVVFQLGSMGKAAIGFASDLEEADSKFQTVFRGQVTAAEAMAEKLNKSYGQSRREAREYLAAMQDLLVPMGMGRIAAAGLSEKIVQLATDLGSFNNRKTADVMRDMQGALVGEFEAFKKYGVILNKAKVEQKAFEMGLASTKEELTGSMTALASYQLMLEGSADAVGDFDRTSEGYANTTKILDAAWEDFSATLGKRLMPAARDAKAALAEMFQEASKMLDNKRGVDEIKKEIETLQASMDKFQKSGIFKGGSILPNMVQTMRGLRKELAQEELKADNERIDANKAMLDLQAEDAKTASEQAATLKAKLAKKSADTETKLRARLAKNAAEQAKKFRANTLDEAEREYFKFVNGQLEYDKRLVKEREALWVEQGFDKVAAAEWAAGQIKKLDEDAVESTINLYETMGSTLESSLGNVFADALRGDLDSFEDYFGNFTNSLASMWGNMAAEMVISQAMIQGVTAGGFAGAGVGIAALMAVSTSLDKQSEKDDRRFAELESAFRQENQLTGSILGDLNMRSESSTNALNDILDVNIAGLEISKGMLEALRFVATNNERIASNIGRGTGDITNPDFVRSYSTVTGAEGNVGAFIDDAINAQIQFFTGGIDEILGTGLGSAISNMFGSTKKSLIDSGIKVYSQNMTDLMEGTFEGATFQTIKTRKRRGFRKKTSIDTSTGVLSEEISGGLGAMFEGIADALSLGADTFGIALEGMYDSLTIAEQEISLKGMTAQEAAETIGNFVSMTADSWAETVLTGTGLLENYQEAGEGAFETYVRLANETEFFTSSLGAMGIAIGATGTELVNIGQQTIEAAGGLEALQSSMSGFYSSFFSDAEKQQNLLGSMQIAFADMNTIMPATRDGFKDLVTGLDLTKEADQERFATLISMSATADQYYSALEESSKALRSTTIDRFTSSIKLASESAQAMESAFNAFSGARDTLISEISSDQTYGAVRDLMFGALESARGGDLSEAVAVSGRLSALSGGPAGATTELEFKREQLQTLAALTELEQLTGAQLSTEELIVSSLEAQVAELQTANDLTIASTNAMINSLSGIESALTGVDSSGVTIPGFAAGGIHSGGLRMVGENGPELEYTPPSRIYSNSDTRNMLDNAEVVAAINALREVVFSSGYATSKSTQKSFKILERWDYDGMPPERVVA